VTARLLGAVAVLALAGVAASAGAAQPVKANPCFQVKNCKVTAGPWVAVPASGEADFLLECPKRSGTIGGTDALATSQDVRVVWEGNAGSPVRPGTSTGFFAFFRAVSAHGHAGMFQPYIGCIPQQKVKPRATVSARVIVRPGPSPDRKQTTVPVKAGASQTATQSCGKHSRLINGWYAVVFGSSAAPSPELGGKVHVSLSMSGNEVTASIRTDAGIPTGARAEVQVGAECSL
jgi:hypothetical protein